MMTVVMDEHRALLSIRRHLKCENSFDRVVLPKRVNIGVEMLPPSLEIVDTRCSSVKFVRPPASFPPYVTRGGPL